MGPDLWGANGTTTTSKLFVPFAAKLIGTIKCDNLQRTGNTIMCYRHPSALSALRNTDPRMTIPNTTGINKTTELYG